MSVVDIMTFVGSQQIYTALLTIAAVDCGYNSRESDGGNKDDYYKWRLF